MNHLRRRAAETMSGDAGARGQATADGVSDRLVASGLAVYLCSLGTNTVLGKVTNGLFVLLLDCGPEN